jgi:hypothetical protein
LTFQDTVLKRIAAFALEIKFMVNSLSIETIYIIPLIHIQDRQSGAESSSQIGLPERHPLSLSKVTLLGTDQARHHDVYKLSQDGIVCPLSR